MKNILISLILITSLGINSKTNAQSQLQLGAGTTVTYSYGPIFRSSSSSTLDYSRYNYLYLQNELATIPLGATITKVEWRKSSTYYTTGNATFNIWMKNSALTALTSGTTWGTATTGATQVYNKTDQTIPGITGWIEFPLTTPFLFTGGALEIFTDWDISAVSGNPSTGSTSWYYSSGFANIVTIGYANSAAMNTATPLTTSSQYGGKYRPDIRITYTVVNQPMVYDSSSTIQPIIEPIKGALLQQPIVAVKVNVTGNQNPNNLTSITFNTNGSTNTANISKAELFYTTSLSFSNAIKLGADVLNPDGSFTFTPLSNNTLSNGANYYWLTYDVAPGTNDMNLLDAECSGFILSGSSGSQTPSVTNPGNGREVRYPLTGIKTINSSLPTSGNNYQSFTEAINSLVYLGVGNGGVTFNVASGTYTEQINIPEINGSTINNKITIQSATGNPDDVILQYTPNSTNNYVVQFNGSDNITLQNMTLSYTGAVGTNTVIVSGIGMSDGITLYGNKIITAITTGTSSYYSAIFFQTGTGNISNNTTIQNNIIQNGSYGIYLYGGSSTVLESGNIISGNTINNFYAYGIYSYYQNAVKIEGNTINSRGTYTTEYGIYMNYNDNFSTAVANKIQVKGTTTSYGIYIYNCDGQSGQELLIANNFITITNSTNTIFGLDSYSGNYQKIYHNNINILTGPDINNHGMVFTCSSTGTFGNIDVRNNISVNRSSGNAIYITANAVALGYISHLDYNNYYTTGYYLGDYGNSSITNIAAWKSISGKDVNSLSVDPGYLSTTDLHISTAALDNSCPPLIDVPDDIDGIPRDYPTDMGADEFSSATMAVDSIKVTHPTTNFVLSGFDNNLILKMDIFTTGSVNPLQLNSFTFNSNGSTNPLNDIFSAVLWKAGNNDNFSVATQVSTFFSPNGSFSIPANMTLTPGHNYFWLTYSIKATANVLNLVDAELSSIIVSGNNIQPANGSPTGSRLIRNALNGIYTINKTLPTNATNYNSFTEAINDLCTYGVGSGGASFEVANGIYNEQLKFAQIPNASVSNPVLFFSSTANKNDVIIEYLPNSAANYVMQLNGSSYVTFQYMTFRIKDTIANHSYSRVLNGIGTNSFIHFLDNSFIGFDSINASSNASTIHFSANSTNMSNNIRFENNFIQYGYESISLSGYSMYSLSANNIIRNNIITDFYEKGIYAYYQDGLIIDKNIINSKGASTFEYGISVNYCDNLMKITKNKISVKPTTASAYGIYLNFCDGQAGLESMVATNFIVQSNSTGTVYGIFNNYSTYQNIYFNSVQINSGSATSYGFYAIGNATPTQHINLKNNIFSNMGGGYAYYVSTLTMINNSDYNNLYTTGNNLAYWGSNKTNLIALQSASGKDLHSKSIDPLYTSPTDLHITSNINLLASGTTISTITDDIDNESRAIIPCIGADEFIIAANDVKVKAIYTLGKIPLQGGSPHLVKALIENTGLNPKTNLNVSLNITGANTFNTTYTIANLAVSAVDTITFAGFIPMMTGLNNVKVSIPADDVISNNELNGYHQITNETFAFADTTAAISSAGFSSGGGMMLAKFFINGTKQVFSTKAYVYGNNAIGKEIYGVALNANGNILDTSFHKIITANDTSNWVNFDFVNPVLTSTTNGNVYIGIAVASSLNAYLLGYQAENPLRRYSFYYNDGLSLINLKEAFTGKYMIEAIIGDAQNMDASVKQIKTPISGCDLNNQSITISIKNESSNDILASQNSLVASYKINNETIISQMVNTDISAFSSIDFTFNTQADFAAPTADTNYLITAWIDLNNDLLKLNDTLRKSVTSNYIPDLPIVNDKQIVFATSDTLQITTSSADTNIYWYYNNSDTSYFHYGLQYITPVLFDTTTYFVTSVSGKANLKITEVTQMKGGIGANTFPNWMTGNNISSFEGLEISNLGNVPADLSGYKLQFYSTDATNAINGIYNFLPGTFLSPGDILILDITSTSGDNPVYNYYVCGITGNLMSNTAQSYILKDAADRIIDVVALNGQTIPTSTGVTSNDWSGFIPLTTGLAGVMRTISDNNNASDWINSSNTDKQTIGSLNPTLVNTIPLAGCETSKIPIKALITNFPQNDAGILSIINPIETIKGGTNVPVSVKIKNYGLDTLTAATIAWSINEIEQALFTWNGSIAYKDTTSEIIIANQLFNIPGIYSIKCWTVNPNNSTDNFALNDTAQRIITVNFAGNYTIGANAADFATINQAVSHLNTFGVGDNVFFDIQAGTYNEKVIINQILGADASNTITFQSENLDSTSVIISDSSIALADNYIIRLNGADYLTIKNITIKNKGITYGKVIDMLNGTNFITIANNVIESSETGTNNTAGIYSSQTSVADSNIVIENNIIKNGFYGIYLYGSSSSNKESNSIIRNNQLIDFFYYGMFLYYQNNITVTANYLKNRSTSTTQYGIYHASNDNVTNTKNSIYLRGSSLSYGLYLENNNTNSGNSLIANNFISQSVGSGGVYGLYSNSSKQTKYYYNTVSITKGNSTTSYAFYNSNSSGIQLLNNIFSNTGGGYAYYFATTTGIDSSNYNCLYSTGNNLAYWGSDKNNLSAFQAVSGRDAASFSFYPNFADSINNLHLTNYSTAELATPVPEVIDDIDGQPRGYFPSIGADEYLLTKTLYLRVFPEGLFNGINLNAAFNETSEQWGASIADRITVELHNSQTATIAEVVFADQELSTEGNCTVTIPGNNTDSYYIVVKHKNSIPVWSSSAVSFNSSIINYDFTISASKAYGDNQKQKAPGKFVMFVGDVNQDGVVDISDLVYMDNDLTNGTLGYIVYDLNGDGVVDISDLVVLDENLTNGVVEITP